MADLLDGVIVLTFDAALARLLVVGTIPTAVIGLAFEDYFEALAVALSLMAVLANLPVRETPIVRAQPVQARAHIVPR